MIPPSWPRRAHSSSPTCGANGATISTNASATSRGSGPADATDFVRWLLSSISLAIAVLNRSPSISVRTTSIVRCSRRRVSASAGPAPTTAAPRLLRHDVAPQPLQEAVHADDVAGLPRARGVQRSGGHQVQPQRVAAVGVVDLLRRDRVLEALAHLAPLPVDGLARVGERAVGRGDDVLGLDVEAALVRVRGGQHVALVEQPGVRLDGTRRGRGRTAPCARSGRTAGAARRARHRRRRGRRRRGDPGARRSAGPSSSARRRGRRTRSRSSGRSSAARTSTSRPNAASRWCRGGTPARRRRGRA